jgi:guanine deaminase
MTCRVVRGGLLVDADRPLGERADLLLRDGRIVALLPPDGDAPPDAEPVDARRRLVMPGFVNAHTHSHGALARGAVADRAILETFLCAAGGLVGGRSPEDIRLSTLLSAVELVRRGCTACYDLAVELPLPTVAGLHAVALAYEEVGMRAVVAPMLSDRTLFSAIPGLHDALSPAGRNAADALTAAPMATSLHMADAALREWPCNRARVRPALGPSIPLHCSDAFLRACRRLADAHGVGLHTHLAESPVQVAAGRARYGQSLTAHLSELGWLGPDVVAAHGVWLDAADLALLADSGAGVAHNPCSNLRIGSGLADVRAMLTAGVRVGVGTDASNTSDGQNMFEATRLAALLSRLRQVDPAEWLSAQEAFRLATQGSAALLGFDDIGRIAVGAWADLVFLDTGAPGFVPLRAPLEQLVLAESGAAVTDVMVAGRTILAAGRLLTVDEPALARAAAAAATRLDTAATSARRFAEAVAPEVEAFCRDCRAAAWPMWR